MKLNIVQIILGIGIISVMAFSIALDPTDFYIHVGEPGSRITIFNTDTMEVAASVLSFLVLLSGTAIVVNATLRLIAKIRYRYIEPVIRMNTRTRTLIGTQIGLAIMVIISAIIITIWGFPTSYTYVTPDNLVQIISINPGPQFIQARVLSAIVILIGLVSLLCGIAELRSSES